MGKTETENQQKTTLVSKNITVLGRRTSVRLEPEMWGALGEIAQRENCKIHDICSVIALRKNPNTSLTAAIRVFMMLYYRAATTEQGHSKAQHGNFMNMLRRGRLDEQPIARQDKCCEGVDEGADAGIEAGETLNMPADSEKAVAAMEKSAAYMVA